MATTMADIRAGLVTNLERIQDVTGKPQVNAYRMSNPTLPSVQVTGYETMEPITFHRGATSIPVIVQAFAANSTTRGGQELLDQWLFPTGSLSIWAAIMYDRTLGGKVDDLMVTSCDGSQIVTLDNSVEAVMSTWHVQVEI